MQSKKKGQLLGNANASIRTGVAFMNQQQFPDAIAAFDRALKNYPDLAILHFHRGNALMKNGNLAQARASYLETLRLNPEHAKAMLHLSMILLEKENFSQAETWLRKARQLNPNLTATEFLLARALSGQQKHQQAIEYYAKVLEENPNNLDCRLDMITALAEIGKFPAAIVECRKVLKIDSRQIRAYSWLTRLQPNHLTHADVKAMSNLANDSTVPQDQRRTAHFALGRLFENTEKYHKSFHHYAAGNSLKQVKHNPTDNENYCNQLMATFSDEFFSERRHFGLRGKRPVFIIGMPRTGTTLSEQILTSHRRVQGVGERDEIRKIGLELAGGTGEEYPEVLNTINADAIAKYANRYLQRLGALVGDTEDLIVNKLPSNFFHLGLIQLMYPDAIILHCRRHPLDTCLSCYFQSFVYVHYSFDLEHLGRFYRQYQRLMAHWKRTLTLPILDIPYEELVQNQEAVTRRILKFMDLPWDENCLRFHENKKSVKTPSLFQVRQPLYQQSVSRWKNYQQWLKPLIDALEYAENEP